VSHSPNGLRVSTPQTCPITHLNINDERFELVENDLVQNGFCVYELKKGEVRQGKDYAK